MRFLPRSVKGTLLFYFTSIIVFTNGFMALVILSRENLRLYEDALDRARVQADALRLLAADRLSGQDPHAFSRLILDRDGKRRWPVGIRLFDRAGDGVHLTGPGSAPGRLDLDGSSDLDSWVRSRAGRADLVVRIASGDEVLGFLTAEIGNVRERGLHDAVWLVVLTAGVNIVVGFSLAVFVAQVILRPMAALLDGLDAVRSGDFGQQLPVQGDNELAELGRHFNEMAASLRAHIAEISDRNRDLDEKLQELWEIYELTRAMGSTMDLQRILTGFMEKAMTLSFSSYAQVLLHEPDRDRLEVGVETSSLPCVGGERYRAGLMRCLHEQTVVEDVGGRHALLFLPLQAGREVQGVLFLGKSGTSGYAPGIRRFLDTIAPLGASLIANVRLFMRVVSMHEYVTQVIASLDAGILTLDDQDRVVTMNGALAQVLGLSQLPAVGQTLADALAPVADQAFVAAIMPLFSSSGGSGPVAIPDRGAPLTGAAPGGRLARRETEFRVEGQPVRNLSVRVIPMVSDARRQGRLVVIEDLTAVRSIERQMVAAEKWVALGRLAASVAHEIRNPLVAIRSLVEVLRDEAPSDGEARQHTAVILGEVDRLNRVVTQLLQYARPAQPSLAVGRIDAVLESIWPLIAHEANRQRVRLLRRWPDRPVYARIDHGKLEQACLNVMFNAIQAMPDGGELAIDIVAEGDTVSIRFVDQGVGIAPETLARVGEPFFTTKTRGSGLGLAITRQILEQHGGQCAIASVVGAGTTVTFALPRVDPVDAPGHAALVPSQPAPLDPQVTTDSRGGPGDDNPCCSGAG